MKNMINVSVLRVFDLNKKNTKQQHNDNNPIKVIYENGIYKLDDSKEKYNEMIKKNSKMIPIEIKTPIKNVVNHLVYRLQKEKLNPLETALVFKELVQITEKKQSELIRELNKTQGDISNKMRLLSLPNYIQLDIIDGRLTERHGRALLQLGNEKYEENLRDVHQEIINKKLKVKDTETIINKILGKEIKVENNPKIKKVEEKRELNNKTGVLAINQINSDLKESLKIIEKYYPELIIEKDEGLIDKNYNITITIKNIN